MKVSGGSIRLMQPLFQEEKGGSTPTSPLLMRVERIDYQTARQLNRQWHSRLPRIGDPPGTTNAMLCFCAEYQSVAYAIAIWSHPVNRSLPQIEWLELRRANGDQRRCTEEYGKLDDRCDGKADSTASTRGDDVVFVSRHKRTCRHYLQGGRLAGDNNQEVHPLEQ